MAIPARRLKAPAQQARSALRDAWSLHARTLNAPAQQTDKTLADVGRDESNQNVAHSPKEHEITSSFKKNDLEDISAQLELGNKYEEDGNFEEAERCYTVAAFQYGSPEGFMELGLLYILADASTNAERQSLQDEAMGLIAEAERLGNEVAVRFLREHGARKDKGRTGSSPSQETDEINNPLCYDTIMDCMEITEGGGETAEGACRTFVERYLREKGERCSPKELEIRTAKVVEAVDGPLPRPKSWEELMELIPDIQSWAEYRDANPGKSIVDYLTVPEWLGRWTLTRPGLARPELKHLYPIDSERPMVGSPYEALKNWLKRTDDKGERNQMPSNVHIPDLSDEIDRLAASQEPGEATARHFFALRARKERANGSRSA